MSLYEKLKWHFFTKNIIIIDVQKGENYGEISYFHRFM